MREGLGIRNAVLVIDLSFVLSDAYSNRRLELIVNAGRHPLFHPTGVAGAAREGFAVANPVAGIIPLRMKEKLVVNAIEPRKTVHVRAYTRTRFSKREHVRAHWRSEPHQYDLFR
jgi:hypothetical protein